MTFCSPLPPSDLEFPAPYSYNDWTSFRERRWPEGELTEAGEAVVEKLLTGMRADYAQSYSGGAIGSSLNVEEAIHETESISNAWESQARVAEANLVL